MEIIGSILEVFKFMSDLRFFSASSSKLDAIGKPTVTVTSVLNPGCPKTETAESGKPARTSLSVGVNALNSMPQETP